MISDEIYHGLVYGDTAHSALEFADDAFVLNGFSKLFAMTGWRLGYIIAPPQHVRRLQILQQNFFISPNSFVQRGGISALTETHPEIEEMRRQYDARRRYLWEALPKLGLVCPVEPKGAFYFFVNAARIDDGFVPARLRYSRHGGRRGHAGNRFRRARRGLPENLLRELARKRSRGNPETLAISGTEDVMTAGLRQRRCLEES